jgi:hypothetical protein
VRINAFIGTSRLGGCYWSDGGCRLLGLFWSLALGRLLDLVNFLPGLHSSVLCYVFRISWYLGSSLLTPGTYSGPRRLTRWVWASAFVFWPHLDRAGSACSLFGPNHHNNFPLTMLRYFNNDMNYL